MKIIVPLAGAGRRFRKAGFTGPKPLIAVDGRPMARHVVDLFPGEKDFLFVANSEDAEGSGLLEVLAEAAPASRTAVIPPHREGPVFSVSRVFDQIPDDDEVIVNYCDFSKAWDYAGFLRHTRSRKADGALSAYRGFHPHMLWDPNYAFLRSERQWLSEIREKRAFTDRRMGEFASDGTYYFRTGSLMKTYFSRLMERGIRTEGEYYVSMAYNLMVEDGLKVSVYAIEQMLQWGTPSDLLEYQGWSDYFRAVVESGRPAGGPSRKASAPDRGILLMAMAGEGRRFSAAGLAAAKPLVQVNGTPMFVQALRCLPRAEKEVLVASRSTLEAGGRKALRRERPEAEVVELSRTTGGQALSCRSGLSGADPEARLLIAPCDAGAVWDRAAYGRLLADPGVDVAVWTVTGHAPAARKPGMFGWVKAGPAGRVTAVGVKEPVSSNPMADRVILGIFTFKKVRHFHETLKALESGPTPACGEYHVDGCVAEAVRMGLGVYAFDVRAAACWGTPEELATYLYWQKFFHRCARHPYDLAAHPGLEDPKALEASFEGFKQEFK
ncbi:MAG: NTP transferase domain-containing protein [Elusimicrobia bacterium]|nr:NTP transferase domain-containing protein [Elusimicrobiota bacterium]